MKTLGLGPSEIGVPTWHGRDGLSASICRPTRSGRAFAFWSGAATVRQPELWISFNPQHEIAPVHICLKAKNRQEVDAFYKAAIAAGMRDNGPPGLRPMYHPNYYAAFVLDPDGHNLEAVFHG